MAITSSAKRAIRVSARKREFNVFRRDAISDTVKNFKKLTAAGKKEEAAALLSKAYQALDKGAKRGVIKPNTAARKKSRLSKLLATAK